MNGVGDGGTIVWQRAIDEEAGSRRWRRFLQFYVGPVVVVAIIAAVAGGVGAALGILILTGLFGLLIAGWIWFLTFNQRSGAQIRFADGEIVFGKKRISLADLESWTTIRPKRTRTQSTPRVELEASVVFRFPMMEGGARGVRADGGDAYRTESFGWATMSQPEIDSVREALTPHIPAPWLPLDELTA